MPTKTFRVNALANDYNVERTPAGGGAATFNTDFVNVPVGNNQVSGAPAYSVEDSGLRFVSVDIPQGAVVTAAFIRFIVETGNSVLTVNVTISANDADNPAAPTTVATYDALVITTATVAWSPAAENTIEAVVDTPSLVTVIQEILDRPGWASGNALQVLFKDNGSSNGADREYYSYDNTPSKAPLLSVTYAEQGGLWIEGADLHHTDASNNERLAQHEGKQREF